MLKSHNPTGSITSALQKNMTSISTLFHRPLSKLRLNSYPKLYKRINADFSLQFRTPKQSFAGKFLAEKTGMRETRRIMIKTSVFGDSDGDDNAQVLEQEAFIDRPAVAGLQGLEPTLNRLSKWLIAALFGGVLLWRHDAEALWVAMGSGLNTILSVVLKRLLNQERPVAGLKSDPGMPSSHAQSIFFTVVFTIASVLEWRGVNELSLTISALALAFGSYLSWLRVSQQFHTMSQIVVGGIIGFIFSILWYSSWDAVVLEAFNSSLLVRVIIILGSAGYCLGFLIYVAKYWFKDES